MINQAFKRAARDIGMGALAFGAAGFGVFELMQGSLSHAFTGFAGAAVAVIGLATFRIGDQTSDSLKQTSDNLKQTSDSLRRTQELLDLH